MEKQKERKTEKTNKKSNSNQNASKCSTKQKIMQTCILKIKQLKCQSLPREQYRGLDFNAFNLDLGFIDLGSLGINAYESTEFGELRLRASI